MAGDSPASFDAIAGLYELVAHALAREERRMQWQDDKATTSTADTISNLLTSPRSSELDRLENKLQALGGDESEVHVGAQKKRPNADRVFTSLHKTLHAVGPAEAPPSVDMAGAGRLAAKLSALWSHVDVRFAAGCITPLKSYLASFLEMFQTDLWTRVAEEARMTGIVTRVRAAASPSARSSAHGAPSDGTESAVKNRRLAVEFVAEVVALTLSNGGRAADGTSSGDPRRRCEENWRQAIRQRDPRDAENRWIRIAEGDTELSSAAVAVQLLEAASDFVSRPTYHTVLSSLRCAAVRVWLHMFDSDVLLASGWFRSPLHNLDRMDGLDMDDPTKTPPPSFVIDVLDRVAFHTGVTSRELASQFQTFLELFSDPWSEAISDETATEADDATASMVRYVRRAGHVVDAAFFLLVSELGMADPRWQAMVPGRVLVADGLALL